MAVYQCKMCGGDIIAAEGATIGTCKNCGRTSTLPNIYDEQRVAKFNRGNEFRRRGEYDRALTTFEQLIDQDITNAEAHWNAALCRFGIEYVEDPDTHKYIATCHRTTYDSILDDVDYLDAVKYADPVTREMYVREAQYIDGVQKGIIAISRNEEPYDIFICYKESTDGGSRTKDSVYAQDLYNRLVKEGYRVFFARITLEGKLGVQYEPYIFSALNSAKVMLVVCTSTDNVNSPWVMNEWRRFFAMAKKDDSKVLIPCYRDMDPYDLPDELAILQGQDMGKIGFEQDLLRGIAKIVKKDEPKTVTKQEAATATVSSLLKRADMFLSDCNWESARQYYDRVLDINPECAEAYAGHLCSMIQAPSISSMGTSFAWYYKSSLTPYREGPLPPKLIECKDFAKAMKFASQGLKKELEEQSVAANQIVSTWLSDNIHELQDDGEKCLAEINELTTSIASRKDTIQKNELHIEKCETNKKRCQSKSNIISVIIYGAAFIIFLAASIHGVSTNKAVFGRVLVNIIGIIIYFFIAAGVASVLAKLLTSPYDSSVTSMKKEIDEYNNVIKKANQEIGNLSIRLSKAEDNYGKIQSLLLSRKNEMSQCNVDGTGDKNA